MDKMTKQTDFKILEGSFFGSPSDVFWLLRQDNQTDWNGLLLFVYFMRFPIFLSSQHNVLSDLTTANNPTIHKPRSKEVSRRYRCCPNNIRNINMFLLFSFMSTLRVRILEIKHQERKKKGKCSFLSPFIRVRAMTSQQ